MKKEWEQNSEKKISFWDWIPNNQESQLFLIIGRLTTFNFNNNVNSAHLQSQDYAICIRREVGKKWIKSSQFTLVSLINFTSRLPILENSTLHKTKIRPSRLLISLQNFQYSYRI